MRNGGGGGGDEDRGAEADQRLEDLDSLRQSLLGVEEGREGEEEEETGTDESSVDR